MPYYLVQADYSAEATAHLVQHPQHREKIIKETAETLGGKLHAFFYCFGEYDAIALIELPDNRAAAAMSLSADASGALKRTAAPSDSCPSRNTRAVTVTRSPATRLTG